MYIRTTATKKIAELSKRIRAVAGGTSASKTISILLVLIQMAMTDKTAKSTHIVSESLPHLKLAAMADFLKIMKEHNYFDEDKWNKTDYIYTFPNGSTFQFYGADSPDKVHGPRRDRLFVNEANHVPYNSFDQMEVRTNDLIYMDWNPTSEFWFYSEVLPTRDKDLDFITLTYKDNEGLPSSIVQSIESRMSKTGWWNVYGLGKLGESDGKIFTGWQVVDDVPHEARLVRRGLDFGYTNDPSTIIDAYYYNGGYIFKERLYQTGMSNKALADVLKSLNEPQTMVKADSAEPKSIDEISSLGVNIVGVTKGRDSVNQGIQKLQDQRISYTSSSRNIDKEYKNYMWEVNNITGKITNVPIDAFNHCMDAIRYSLDGLLEMDGDYMQQLRQVQSMALAGEW